MQKLFGLTRMMLITLNDLEGVPAGMAPLPTLDHVEAALREINVTTSEERRRAQEARVITRIMKGE